MENEWCGSDLVIMVYGGIETKQEENRYRKPESAYENVNKMNSSLDDDAFCLQFN